MKTQQIKNSSGSVIIRTGTKYTEASGDIKEGAYVRVQNDQNGYSTTYDYNLQSGLLNSVTDALGNETAYTYNSENNNLTKVESGGKTVSYAYDSSKTRLSSITHNGFKYSFTYDTFGNTVATKVAGTTLMTNTYGAGNGLLTKSTYGNGDYNEYVYDDLGRTTRVNKNGSKAYYWRYNASGLTAMHTDYVSDRVYYYTHDSLGRIVSEYEKTYGEDEYRFANSYTYDTSNNLTKLVNTADGNKVTTKYSYDASNRPSKTTLNSNVSHTYTYDALGQLKRENNLDLNKTIVYTYNSGGNLTSRVEYPYTTGTLGTATKTTSYAYDSTWKDKLVTYDGDSITYDAIGNPLTYRDGMSFTWQGRQMKTANLNGTSVSYKYNADGLRTYKKVGSTVHEYEYSGDKLFYEKRGDIKFYYRYDAFGNLAAIKRIKADGTEFTLYVICNSRGDVEELRKTNGDLYARYIYDSWGNTVKIINADGDKITDTANLSVQNPFRYRGYYFDAESGLYYLQSRYYDPQTGRFLNADSIAALVASTDSTYDKNLYAYCDNNPVTRVDVEGDYWRLVAVGAAVGGLVSGAISAWFSYKDDGYIDAGVVLTNVVSGAIVGALSMTSMKRASLTVVNAVLAGTTYMSEQAIRNEPIKADELLVSVASGAFGGCIGGDGLDAKSLSNSWNIATDAIERESRRANIKYAIKEIARHTARRESVKTTVRVALASSAAMEVSLAFAKRKFGY